MTQSPTLWSANAWRITWFDQEKPWRGFFLVNEDTGVSDHPCVYDDGVVAWENPHAIPAYVCQALYDLVALHEKDLT